MCSSLNPGSFYIMDRGYTDFDRLNHIHQAQGFFVIRAKPNLSFQRYYSRPVDKSKGFRCDQTIKLTGPSSSVYYPEQLRHIRYVDPETGKSYVFLTNNFELSAEVIADLYKCRWQIELFFKWIKQHLRIKAFYGTSENAVKSTNLASNLGIRVDYFGEKETEFGYNSLHVSTDFERQRV